MKKLHFALSLASCMLKLGVRRVCTLRSILAFAMVRLLKRDARLVLLPERRPLLLRGGTSDAEVFFDIFGSGSYELPYPESVRTIVDGGANVGYAAVWYARRFPEARIFAVEPDLSNLRALRENVQGLDNVTVVEGAVWYEKRKLRILDPTASSFAVQVGETGAGTEVDALRVEDLLNMAQVQRVDILKLDIEGAEKPLFEHARASWLDAIGSIVIEFHDTPAALCARAFYQALGDRPFLQKQRGENTFVRLLGDIAPVS